MPTYDYECTKCGREFELFQPISEKPKRRLKTDCDQCSNRAPVKRLIGTGGGVLFKGSGFYQTDYRSEGYKAAAKKESGDGKAKSDGKKSDGKSPAKSESISESSSKSSDAKSK